MIKNILKAIIKSSALLLSIFFMFTIVEPAVSEGQTTTFSVSQIVVSELAFATPASSIVLAPSIDTSVGGQASGETQVVVKTNDSSGYSMTIMASSSVGMIGVASSTQSIPAYITSVPGVPDFTFNVPANTAYFGYTVQASTSSDLATAFKDSLGVCGSVSGGDTADRCWIAATTTPYTIVNRTNATLSSGATTTLKFMVAVNPNPVPAIANDIYVATTTLTATTN